MSKEKVYIKIREELGFYTASTVVKGKFISGPARISFLGAFNALGLMIQKMYSVHLMHHELEIHFKPE